ncbi:hypothetical protein DFP72DRAFT_808256 [Ephemerocybe angulata]|uniref:Fungal-type protein kinase domain-containing protein n=1 Tax=Ephemerocybe angulata TaxID=980116 RepID=A0A8H6I4U3_9AGAR|nr:hypothetical protein DFP72DRAFT_808256 [Tulosesus angulatus]
MKLDPNSDKLSIAIKATGPSFEGASAGPSNVATVFIIKLDAETDDDKPYPEAHSETEELGIYARFVSQIYTFLKPVLIRSSQIFQSQPNRRFVRTLVITERRFRLIQLDREGAIFSPLLNYHEDFDTFIRAILSLGSTDEEEVGLDTSVQWEVVEGRKVSGTITTFDEKSKTFNTYTMTDDPVTGTLLLIKDAWIYESADLGRKEEHYYLAQAAGIAGVIQMVGYEDRKGEPFGEIKSFRPTDVRLRNRIFRRLVLEKYGKDIDEFRSQLELVCALHDAIEAHGKLYQYRNILHRDISCANILLGQPGAPLGSRGVLIDMDHAIEVQYQDSAGAEMGGAVGSPLFQAYFVLKGSGLYQYRPTHDYLDDLEAFFYILYVLMHHIARPQERQKVSFQDDWCHDDPEISATAKRGLFNAPINMDAISEFWGQPCRDALVEFHKFVKEIILEKEEMVGDMDKEWDLEPMFALHSQVYDHYARVLDIFKKAIKELSPESASSPRPPLAPTTRTNKRDLCDDVREEDKLDMKVKRTCLASMWEESIEI